MNGSTQRRDAALAALLEHARLDERPESIELHPVRFTYASLPDALRSAAPALLTHFSEDGPSLIPLCSQADWRDRVQVLRDDGRVERVSVATLARQLRAGLEGEALPKVEAMLDRAGVSGSTRAKARQRLLERQLGGRPMGGATLVRAAPGASLRAQVMEASLMGPLVTAVLASVLTALTALVGWGIIGLGALEGRLAPSWVAGWLLLTLTATCTAQLARAAQGYLAIRGGSWMKRMLLRGAMATDPQDFKRDGVGGALARVQESQAIEDLVLSGGLAALFATVDLIIAAGLLTAASPLLLLLFAATLAGLAAAIWRLDALQHRWTHARRQLTQLLVERMNGHRTRLAQAQPDRRYDGEDEALAHYSRSSQQLDRHIIGLEQALSAGFLTAGLLGMAGLMLLAPQSPTWIALALGALVWTQATLLKASGQLASLSNARVSWGEVGPLLSAARNAEPLQPPKQHTPAPPGSVMLRSQELGFAWRPARPVLDGIDLQIRHGERCLLTGPSGSGKSTLVKLLTGTATPHHGALLLDGRDPGSLGSATWRRRAVSAPQFHDNHLFEHSLLFNLLMGRAWPASEADIGRADDLCRRLGLGPLLDRMPMGLNQTVGESGWQLSHGERSRVFLARALLQDADLVVLDESFAALDPKTLQQCLRVAEDEARSLMIVAHP